ncbi:zinc finger CCHC domain-containing protein 17 isoform X1 [Salminus brasiliensis]|uniref:zinc finger CCHC domain-containing protein 17 isoform X1 n=1 Tax=Salminus brasiliensis TaxID=930266 RepID=UPI003B839815
MADEYREPAGLDGLPELYSILRGEVASVTDYGAFVKIPGYRKQGLVHKSEMSASRVDNPSEIVDVGEQVWIKVIGKEINDEKVKLSFSMKAVNQGTGRDLDPNNVMAEQDARRRRRFQDNTGQRITLEAVLNTTCKKCGCTGHFAKDCFSQAGLQYSLVPEEEEEPAGQSVQSVPQKRKKVVARPSHHTLLATVRFIASEETQQATSCITMLSFIKPFPPSLVPYLSLSPWQLYYQCLTCLVLWIAVPVFHIASFSAHRKRKPRKRKRRKRENDTIHLLTAVMIPKGSDTPIHILRRRKSTRSISIKLTNEWSVFIM